MFVIDLVARVAMVWGPAFGCCSGLPCVGTYLSRSTLLVGRKHISCLLVDQLSNPTPNHLAHRTCSPSSTPTCSEPSAIPVLIWCSQQPHQARRKDLLLETAGERMKVTTEYIVGVGSGSPLKGDPESF